MIAPQTLIFRSNADSINLCGVAASAGLTMLFAEGK